MRRRTDVAFAAGAYVFPGGTLDAADADAAWEDWLHEPPEEAVAGAADPHGPSARTFVVAALRELFEETGVLLAAGPPLYLSKIPVQAIDTARRLARRMAEKVNTLILDHHLLRSEAGEAWLEDVGAVCAADFMRKPRRLLEAHRKRLYREQPVPRGWHRDYQRGRTTTEGYRA